MNSHSSEVLAGKQIAVEGSRNSDRAPARPRSARAENARCRCDDFYKKRIPPNYSFISSRIGESGGRIRRAPLARAIHAGQARMPSSLRSPWMPASAATIPPSCASSTASSAIKTFFIIRAMSLTGQQGGLVNLRLRVSTWLRPADVRQRIAVDSIRATNRPAAPPAAAQGGRITMALALGTENKRQVILVIVLFAVILGVRRLADLQEFRRPLRAATVPAQTSARTLPAVAERQLPLPATKRKSSPTPASIPHCTLTSWPRAKMSNTPARAETSSPPSPRPRPFPSRLRARAPTSARCAARAAADPPSLRPST